MVHAWSAFRLARTAKALATTVPIASASTIPAASPATTGLRRHQRHARSAAPTGRARIGSPARYRRRSPARAAAEGYRFPGSFSRHFRQIVSRSRGIVALSRRGGTGSSATTIRTVSSGVAAWNGGRPVTARYSVAPRAYTSAAGLTAPRRPPACSGGM